MAEDADEDECTHEPNQHTHVGVAVSHGQDACAQGALQEVGESLEFRYTPGSVESQLRIEGVEVVGDILEVLHRGGDSLEEFRLLGHRVVGLAYLVVHGGGWGRGGSG